MEQALKKYKNNKGKNVTALMLFFPLSLLYQELIIRAFTFGELKAKQFVYIALFSLSIGFILSFILSLIKNKRAAAVTSIVLSSVISVIYGSQLVYYHIFYSFFSWDSVGMAGEAVSDFIGQVLSSIGSNIIALLLLFVPLAALIAFHKFLGYAPKVKKSSLLPLLLAAISAITFTVAAFSISSDRTDMGAFYLYRYPNDKETAQYFGVLTSARLNISKIIFGRTSEMPVIDVPESIYNPFESQKPADTSSRNTDIPESKDVTGTDPQSTKPIETDAPGTEPRETDNPVTKPSDTKKPETTPYKPVSGDENVMNIDFDALIASAPNKTIKDMHQYFSSRTPTKTSEYTGMFAGKNLIMLTLEGFSGKVIDPTLTPTLYMMATQGFVFNNYYCSCWGGSTATGEYANMTGNFYNKASCLKTSGSNYLPFCLGNQFSKLGYYTPAYHGHTYTYYSRDVSHPNMGYKYLGIGNGLEKLKDSNGDVISGGWPRSDEEVANVTIGQYIDKQPFHVYYMTISGHANYSWGGNKMSNKHSSDVENLPYSEEVQAYIASQLEVELMLKKLVQQLSDAGILEDTVFVMAADHYPFGLSNKSLAELYGLPKDDADNVHKYFDLYKNSLIIWSASMKNPVTVDTPCSAIDILPTVSNLFGLEYDSRLIMGTDVLSGTDPIVILNCDGNGTSWNWINRYGVYNSSKGFTAAEGYEADSAAIKTYVKQMNSVVSAMRTYSFKILTENYYKYVFKK